MPNFVLKSVPRRLLFRMTFYGNLQPYLEDGCIYAKNHKCVQQCYQISFDEIVNRRGESGYATPLGSNINCFVPFYFSPITKMAYSVHHRRVALKNPAGQNCGDARMEDVAFLIVDPETLFGSGREVWFTDIACNSAIQPEYENRPAELENHVEWSLFDEDPRVARIDEINYMGVCKYQFDRDIPVEHQMRSKKRMAEFLVRDYLRMDEVLCIIVKSAGRKEILETWVNDSGREIPVYVKPRCYP